MLKIIANRSLIDESVRSNILALSVVQKPLHAFSTLATIQQLTELVQNFKDRKV